MEAGAFHLLASLWHVVMQQLPGCEQQRHPVPGRRPDRIRCRMARPLRCGEPPEPPC